MIIFDWVKDKLPPEPAANKNGWQLLDPAMARTDIYEWYEANFEMYACKLKGSTGNVPAQLYYVGNGEWMSETGRCMSGRHVEAWASYGYDAPAGGQSEAPVLFGMIKVNGVDTFFDYRGNILGRLAAAAVILDGVTDDLDRPREEVYKAFGAMYLNSKIGDAEDE